MQAYNRPGVEHEPYSPLYRGGPTWEEILGKREEDIDHVIW